MMDKRQIQKYREEPRLRGSWFLKRRTSREVAIGGKGGKGAIQVDVNKSTIIQSRKTNEID